MFQIAIPDLSSFLLGAFPSPSLLSLSFSLCTSLPCGPSQRWMWEGVVSEAHESEAGGLLDQQPELVLQQALELLTAPATVASESVRASYPPPSRRDLWQQLGGDGGPAQEKAQTSSPRR